MGTNEQKLTKYTDVDVSGFTFPTDSLTVADLRKRFPQDLSWPQADAQQTKGSRPSLEDLKFLIQSEQEFACRVVCQAHRIPFTARQGIDFSLDELRESIIEQYQVQGIATGEELAKQLVRGIESQALAAYPPVDKSR